MRVPEDGNRWLTYRELASRLADYVHDMGFTHVEFLPVTEHPFDASWGYQTVGYFAPTSRFGTPQDFMFLVDTLHQRGIGVILDWVPAHFPRDEHGLAYFDGTHLYEHADPRLGEHQDWGTFIFNYGRNEVRSFLISNALFWLDKYHIDGLRVDAVASMLYLDYSRKEGEWIPNHYGGRENLEAIALPAPASTSRSTATIPDVMTIAEESTAWPTVSRPTYVGGLGFGYKWDMGWMHDTLDYMEPRPGPPQVPPQPADVPHVVRLHRELRPAAVARRGGPRQGSLLSKMPGDDWQKFANLRLLFGYMYAQPGKKLLFMGGEFGQWNEWNHDASLDWHLLEQPFHKGLQRWVRDLNTAYRGEPALHELDCDPAGFEWVDCNDSEQSVISLLRKGKSRGRLAAGGLQLHAGAAAQLPHRRAARRPVGGDPEQRRAALRRQRPGQFRRRGGGPHPLPRPRLPAQHHRAAARDGGFQAGGEEAGSASCAISAGGERRRTPGGGAEDDAFVGPQLR